MKNNTGKKQATKTTKATTKPYEPTERERKALAANENRRQKTMPSPVIKVELDGDAPKIGTAHPDLETGVTLLMEGLGTTSLAFLNQLTSQLVNASTKGKDIDEEALNFMLSVISGIDPRDQMETLLAAQMGAVHLQMMTFARRLTHVETIDQQNSAEKAFNKLARTFTAQMEALNRYRGKGQQKMTVEHVHVHEGGQAIVGTVQGGGVEQKTGEQPHAKEITHAPGETLSSQNQKRNPVPVSRNG